MYLTYTEFQNLNTGVEITESEYNVLYFYAENAIDAYLGRHIDPPPDNVKRACGLQIALSSQSGGVAYYVSKAGTQQLTSESVPDYSYSMGAKSQTSYTVASDTYGLFPIVASMLGDRSIVGVDVIL